MGALDERNLKRAVNRYGTLPKGARIGAYLQSLRDADQPEGGQVDQDEMGATSGGNSGSCNDVAASAAEHASLRQLVAAKAATPQQPMLRYQEIDLTFCGVTFRENFRIHIFIFFVLLFSDQTPAMVVSDEQAPPFPEPILNKA